MAKCKNCENLGYLFDGDRVGERVWCGNIADSPVLDMERDCEYYVPQTNADRIRSMTDEELAEWLTNMTDYFGEDEELYKSIYNLDTEKLEEIHDSYGDLLNWLQSETE